VTKALRVGLAWGLLAIAVGAHAAWGFGMNAGLLTLALLPVAVWLWRGRSR
jgi:hypothetical protein